MKLERVEGALEEVIERLQDRDMQTVATYESFTLQRWQEAPSTIASSRPTTPNYQISAARSESEILSEAGFSERSIPMSAYQFNDMGARGKGVLISDGTQAKAYAVKAHKQRKGLDLKPPEARVPSTGSSAGSSKPLTKATKPAPLASIPEPEEGDEVLDAKDDGKPGMTIDSQTFIKTPSKKERPKPPGALYKTRHRLKNFRKPRPKADSKPTPQVSGDGVNPLITPKAVEKPRYASAGAIIRAPPLRALAQAPVAPRKSPKLAMERFLQVVRTPQNSAPGNPSRGLGDTQKPLVSILWSSTLNPSNQEI